MKILKNKKGMTLVEIIVVLLIMSILLVIMGSLILNAFSYFNKTTDQDINKRSLDSISEYVRSELLYASDVRVQEEKPDDEEWNTLYIVDGKLYKNDETVYSEGFYNHNDLVIKLRGFEQYRLDLNYSFKNMDKANAYSTEDTLELLNLKVKIASDDEFNPFSNISTVTTVTDKVKIYYQKSIKEEEEAPEENNTQEVSSNQCLNGYNNRGVFELNRYYQIGDMAYFEGYWWLNYLRNQWIGNISDGPGKFPWKKIDKYFDLNSAYAKEDIIIYKIDGNYYKCSEDRFWYTDAPNPNNIYSNGYKLWGSPLENTKTNLTCYINPDNNTTVANKLDYDNLDNYEEFENGKDYEVGTIVFKKDKKTNYVEYYMKVLESNGTNGPNTNPKGGWQRLTRDWDENSAYKKGDVVIYTLNSHLHFIQAQQDINEKTVNFIIDNNRFDGTYWKEVYK